MWSMSGFGEDHVRAATDVAPLLGRRVTVIDRRPQPGQAERRERPGLILSQRLGRIEQERSCVWVARDRLQHGQRERKRLSRRGRGRDDRVATGGSDVPQLGLMRPEPGDPATVERSARRPLRRRESEGCPSRPGWARSSDGRPPRRRREMRSQGASESVRTPRGRARTPRRTGVGAGRPRTVARGSPSVNTIVVGIESTP